MIDPRVGAVLRSVAAYIFKAVLCVCLMASVMSCVANATVIVSVSGQANAGESLGANQAAATAFTLTGALSNVTITATTGCVNCQGGIWLNENQIGPGTPFGDTLVGNAYPGTTSITLPSLAAGVYFLVFSNNSGTLAWEGSNPAIVVTSNGASASGDFLASSCTNPLAPLCTFTSVFSVGLNYTVTGTPVPEPSSSLLLATAFAGMAWRRTKK